MNRFLAVVRNLLRIARDEWQWIDVIPKIRLLPGEIATRPLVDARGGRPLDRGGSASPASDDALRVSDRMPGARDYRLGMGPRGFEARDRLVGPDEEWNAARRPAERRCSGSVGS